MVSIVDRSMITFRGLSTDTKPKATNGSVFIEMDTGKGFYFNGETNQWIEAGSGGGGGGSSSLVDIAVVGTALAG